MATITAVKTGHWDDPTVWDLERVPQDGDDVNIAGYQVQITQAMTIPPTGKLGDVTGTSGAIVTYSYEGWVAFYATSIHAGTNNAGIVQLNYGQYFGLYVDDIYASASTNSGVGVAVSSNVSGVYIVGNVHGGGANGTWGINITGNSAGFMFIVGNIEGGSGTASYGLIIQCGSPITVAGNVTGGASGHGINVATFTPNIYITGNIVGGSAGSAYGLYNGSATGGTIFCRGGVYGGTTRTNAGIYNNKDAVVIQVYSALINTLAPAIVGHIQLHDTPWGYVMYNDLKFYISREQIGGAMTNGTSGWNW